jgi:PAP2 superfamily
MMSFFHFLVAYPVLIGVAAALIFIGVRMTYVPADRKRCDWFLAAAALALPANMLSESTALLLSRLRPFKLDEYIFQLDGLLGFQPSFAIGRVLADHLWLKVISSMAYSVLPCAVLVVFGLYLWQRTAAETLTVLRTFLLNLFFAVPLYLLAPACGPAFAFAGFPFALPEHLVPHPILLSAPPNCIPSVHMSTALLVAWFGWRWSTGRLLSVVYTVLIVIATLGSGQHYLFDLVVAIPYAVLMLRLGKIEWKRSSKKEVVAAFAIER